MPRRAALRTHPILTIFFRSNPTFVRSVNPNSSSRVRALSINHRKDTRHPERLLGFLRARETAESLSHFPLAEESRISRSWTIAAQSQADFPVARKVAHSQADLPLMDESCSIPGGFPGRGGKLLIPSRTLPLMDESCSFQADFPVAEESCSFPAGPSRSWTGAAHSQADFPVAEESCSVPAGPP